MKMSGRKEQRTLTIDNEVRGVKRKKKAKVDESNTGHQSPIEVIDLSDSEESTQCSWQQKLIDRRKVKQELRNKKSLRSNCFEVNGTFINQFLETNVKTCEQIGIQENPNQIFLSEDFDLDGSDDSESNFEPADKTGKPDKFYGIGKLVIVHCSMCKITLENVDDNYVRYVRSCLKCQSPVLFECQKCWAVYKYFQSIWDHIERSCKPMEINPSIRELALKASDQRSNGNTWPREKTSVGDQTPTVITLDGDNENKNNDDFVRPQITSTIRIKSIESMRNVVPESTDSQPITDDIDTAKITSKTKKIQSKIIKNSSAPQNSGQKCEFNAELAKEVEKRVAKNNSKKVHASCSRCRSKFYSLKKKNEHERKCGGIIHYKCKFCEQTHDVLLAIKKHLIAKHSKLFKWYEMDGIMMEIKLKRKAAKEIFENSCEEKINQGKKLKNSDVVLNMGDDVDEKIAKLSKINELLRIRCCKCKVTFEKVEEKIILRCPDCQSKLLYRCRLCDKLFAYFDEAWLHISYKCISLKNKKINDTQTSTERSKVPEAPEIAAYPTYDCCHCDYKTSYKWQISDHMKMSHSCSNGNLEINFTACSKCGRTFEHLEDCQIHENLYCGREMLLVCEFCPQVKRRSDAMRIHLVNAHIQQLGNINNLENIMDVIKTKWKNAKEINALPVPNDNFMVIEEV